MLIESWAPAIKLKAKVAKWPKQYLATTKRLWRHCGGHLLATSHCAIVLRALCPQQYKRSWPILGFPPLSHCTPHIVTLPRLFAHMLPPSANSAPLADVFRARVTSLIKEQLKPIVTELATQQQTILTHLALLRHNHNVNNYQSTRLENIRDLEQSIKCAC